MHPNQQIAGSDRAALPQSLHTQVVDGIRRYEKTQLAPMTTQLQPNQLLSVAGATKMLMVAEWGQVPCDVDFHVLSLRKDGKRDHIFFPSRHRQSACGNILYSHDAGKGDRVDRPREIDGTVVTGNLETINAQNLNQFKAFLLFSRLYNKNSGSYPFNFKNVPVNGLLKVYGQTDDEFECISIPYQTDEWTPEALKQVSNYVHCLVFEKNGSYFIQSIDEPQDWGNGHPRHTDEGPNLDAYLEAYM